MRRSLRSSVWVLALAAVAFALPAGKPLYAGTLKPDGRAGTVTAVQGTAYVRPVGRERWTPLDARALLLPGDVVRTEARGAHALDVRLAAGARLLVGPGAQFEVPEAGRLRLLRGDVEVAGEEGSTLRVEGPGGFAREAKGTLWLRASDTETKALDAAPPWLVGYRASTSEEWMGSLLATVDGKAVPLSVGYHKVTVEIRDQIARTTVEESFVNATDTTLEGTFSFPLPADASISGFGMWIGDELVEADLVEKQRARAIYEDILRRKKDPGLLEWEGGNLFKARVFPIFPHSEKRIRIRYTQVLPLEGEAYRYRYALRSELLRLHPLRELSIAVNVLSAAPLRAVSSPTHPVTQRATEHEAVVEFAAQQYVPERDFEVAIETGRGSGLTAVAHRRGDDGWFMLLLAPPDPAAGGWQRDLVPEGDPLELVLVADTSGSMDPAARATQAAFLSALLGQLSAKDRFRLVACDLEARPLVADAVPATEENVARALAALDGRVSLGWTDLERSFDAVAGGLSARTQVVYVGDGIPTSGDADPVATAGRLTARLATTGATFHAVSTSSSYEKGVLEALAAVGGGSVRRADDGPAAAARTLLAEIARPGLRGARVEVRGVPTARVYPEVLPNLPLSAQQVVLGRYLPTADAKGAEVVVTGTVAGKPVSWSAPLPLPAAEEGNSFLPRLWARRHLDVLLAHGRSPETTAEIVAFSREHQIMTPYTSFLVLESDEDREKYGVERTVHMRDAERFFAEARDRAALEIARQQATTARRYRLELRRQALARIANLGRDLPIPGVFVALGWGGGGGGSGGAVRGYLLAAGDGASGGIVEEEMPLFGKEDDAKGGWDAGGDLSGFSLPAAAAAAAPAAAPELREPSEPTADPAMGEAAADELRDEAESDNDLPLEQAEKQKAGFVQGRSKSIAGEWDGRRSLEASAGRGLFDWGDDKDSEAAPEETEVVHGGGLSAATLGFPEVGAAPPAEKATPDPAWDAAILAALKALDRRPALVAMDGAVRVTATWESVHPLQGTVGSRRRTSVVASARRWLREESGFGGWPTTSWLTETDRAVVADDVRLGRRRAANDLDRARWPLPLADRSLGDDLLRASATFQAPTATRQGDVLTVTLRHRDDPQHVLELDVDVVRRVVLEERTVVEGRVASSTRYSDFVEVAGRTWATRVEHRNEFGRAYARLTLAVTAIPTSDLDAALAAAAKASEDVVFLGAQEPTLLEARQAAHDGRAGLPERLVLALDETSGGRWDQAEAAWAQVEEMLAGRPGRDWIRLARLARSRRGTVLGADLAARAAAVAGETTPWTPARAVRVRGLASTAGLGARERLALERTMAGVWSRAGADADLWSVDGRRSLAGALEAAGDLDAAIEARRALAADRPMDVQDVLAYAGALRQGEDLEGAVRETAAAASRRPWTRAEVQAIWTTWTNWLWEVRDLPALEAALKPWLETKPEEPTAYQIDLALRWFRGDVASADRLVAEALATPPAAFADRATRARVQAALQAALGQGWNFWVSQVPEAWRAPLRDLALRCLRADGPREAHAVGTSILGDWRFRQLQEHRAACDALRADLLADGALASMPFDRLLRVLPWALEHAGTPERERLAAALLARWGSASDRDEAARLEPLVLQAIPDGPDRLERVLAFRREVLSRAPADAAPAAARRLLEEVLEAPWSSSLEDEAFALLPRVRAKDGESLAHRTIAAHDVRRLAAWLHEGRFRAALGTPEARAKDARAEAARRTREARTTARRGTAARFAAASASADEHLRPWFEVERLGYDAETQADLARTVGEARELLDAIPRAGTVPLDRYLAERCSVLLAYAATRRSTPEGLADRVLAYFRERLAANDRVMAPRGQIVRLLLALDRPEDLAKALAEWIRPDDVDVRGRVLLAYLQAEQGDLRAAATTLEAAQALGALSPTEWRALAGWYLVLREDARRETALDRALDAAQEWELQQALWQAAARIQRRGDGVPEEIDPESLRALRALFRKSSHPQNHMGQAQNLYAPTKDFRVLEALADGAPGHSAEAAYGYVEAAGSLVEGIHEEATCDALVARLAAVLARPGLTDTDRRALRLLVVHVESRAARVPKGDPVHVERALAALRAVTEGPLADGERALLARRLAAMGNAGPAPLVTEQLARLEGLLEGAGTDPQERLAVGRWLAQALWDRARPDDATDRLDGLLKAVRAAQPTTLAPAATEAHATLTTWWVSRRQFRAAESRLREDIARESRSIRRETLRIRLYGVYGSALEANGATALGQGADLLAAAAAEVEAYLREGPGYMVPGALQAHAGLHRAAARARSAGDVGARYAAFARERAPTILRRDPTERMEGLGTVLQALAEVATRRDALALALDEMDRETPWEARVGWIVWPRFHGWLSEWRTASPGIADLEARLLPRVLVALEQGLVTGNEEGAQFWRRNHPHFWAAQAGRFAEVAERMAEVHAAEPSIVLRVAAYQREGLDLKPRAIQTLQTAVAHGKDPVDLRWTLAQWLAEDRRFPEAWPVIEGLVKEAPDALPYRLLGAKVLSGLGRGAESLALLEDAAKRWKEAKRWTAPLAAALGNAALEAGHAAAAAAWLEDALRLRREAGGGAGPDATLSTWYGLLARARSGLGDTDAAVKAAAAAVVAWGPRMDQRVEALKALQEVIAKAKDLDAWVARYDAEVAVSGLDAPTIRKAIGRVYLDRRRADVAAVHLTAARDLDPADAETHTLLVQALDAAGDAPGALQALLASLPMAPRNLAAYPDLATRYERAKDPESAERARTSLVEAMPAEVDGHRALAEIREAAKRWDLAADRWKQVVRIRSDEPDGWLSLARAQIEAGDKAGARSTLDHVLQTTWEERFGDVRAKAAELLPRTR